MAEPDKTPISAAKIVAEAKIAEPDKTLVPYFEANGIPYCPKCFKQYQSHFEGYPICVDDRKDCPRIATTK